MEVRFHDINKFSKNKDKLEDFGFTVEVGVEMISVSKPNPKGDSDWICFNNFNTIQEFNSACDIIFSLICVDNDSIFLEHLVELRKKKLTYYGE